MLWVVRLQTFHRRDWILNGHQSLGGEWGLVGLCDAHTLLFKAMPTPITLTAVLASILIITLILATRTQHPRELTP